MTTNPRLLIVGVHPGIAGLETGLADLGYTVATVPSGQQAVAEAAEARPDLVVIELRLGGGIGGIEAAGQFRTRFDVPVIFLADEAAASLWPRARMTDPFGCLPKSVMARELQRSIDTALSLHDRETSFRKHERRIEQEALESRREIKKLRADVKLMTSIFDSVSDGVVVMSSDGEFLLVNSTAERISGMGATEGALSDLGTRYGTYYLDGKTPVSSEDLPLVRAIRGESLDDVELLIRNQQRPQGVCISISARPLSAGSGAEGGLIMFRDVTKLKTAEAKLLEKMRELQDQAALMGTIFHSLSDGVVVCGVAGELLVSTPSAEHIAGIAGPGTSPDEWSTEYGIFLPDEETPFPAEDLPMVRALRGEATNDVELFVRNARIPEGAFVTMSGRPLKEGTNEVKGGVVVLRDVTAHVRREQALTQAFSLGKLEVLDTVLHNIGNAINSVSVGLETIDAELRQNQVADRLSAVAEALEAHRSDWITYLDTDTQGRKVMPFIIALAADLAKQNQWLLQITGRVGARVSHIVDIIRTQKALDAGSMGQKIVNPQESITAAVKVLADSLETRGIKVHVDFDRGQAQTEIRIHESRFHQVLVNLIKNSMEAIDALAASAGLDDPHIQIRCFHRDDYLIIDVVDNGIGIDEAHTRLIFGAGYTTKSAGRGLGLHSAANFVIGTGGRIIALSEGIGKGATMRVMLRRSAVAPVPPQAPGVDAGGGGTPRGLPRIRSPRLTCSATASLYGHPDRSSQIVPGRIPSASTRECNRKFTEAAEY